MYPSYALLPHHRDYDPPGSLRYVGGAYLDPKNPGTIRLRHKGNLDRYWRPPEDCNDSYKEQTGVCRPAVIRTHHCHHTYNAPSYKTSYP